MATPELPEIRTTFVEANGQRFEMLVCGEGDLLVLCLHGFPEVALSWRHQMQMLAARGYRVWAPNQRGYGRSSRPLGIQSYAVEHLMADVAGLIDISGAKEVSLLAHDWGAVVAWCFAARQIRPLRRLVIINVPHPLCFLRSLRQPGQLLRSWYVLAFQIPWLPEYLLSRRDAQPVLHSILSSSTAPSTFPRDLLGAIRQNAAATGALRAMIHWYRAFVQGGGLRRQVRSGFPMIETRTLLLWGDKDRFLANYTIRETSRFVRHLTTVVLPGASHWVQQDATDACNQAIASFFQGENSSNS